MRITRARVVSQAFFLALFLFLVLVTQFGHLRGYPVCLFLQVDPLVALATAITTHAVYRGLLWALALLLPTLLLGRFFCGWACPLGTVLQLAGWVADSRTPQARQEANRYRRLYTLKYALLAGLAGAACLGALQIGLLDPVSTLYRALAVALLPAVDLATGWVWVRPHEHVLAWVVGLLFVLVVVASLAVPRFFCRVLCPLGACLGVLSRFSLARVERDPDRCVGCDLCLGRCEGACDPHARVRKAECLVCLNCLDDCPQGALSFRLLPPPEHEVTGAEAGRRRLVLAGLGGLLLAAFTRRSGDLGPNFAKEVVRPPGSLAEPAFLARCLKCDQCVRVCPTNVLQPAWLEAGIEGTWTPVLNMRLGYCELNCVLCGQVCPSGAIQPISLAQKHGTGEFAQAGPLRLGTAFYDRGRCLPWAMDRPCVVCEEVCPTSPKAIYGREESVVRRDGETIALKRPWVDPERCIGCGICQHACPVRDEPAIRVTAIGETRSRDRSLLLPAGGGKWPLPGRGDQT
ncbi:MAG: 4Fe-4S dicluster domain-containing protein [Candidatus Latescibacterota bacterium]